MTITRNSTGKLFFDNFEDGDFTNNPTWTKALAQNASIVDDSGNKKLKLAWGSGQADAVLNGDNAPYSDMVLLSKIKMSHPAFCQSRISFISTDYTNRYEAVYEGTYTNELLIYKRVSGSQSVLASYNLGSWGANERTLAFNWQGTSLKVLVDGSEHISATDSAHASLDKIWLLQLDMASTAGSYDYRDDVILMSSFSITCSGLPTGYKLRVTDGNSNTATATESGGTATVNCSTLTNWPCDKVEVLNSSDVVVETYTATDDVWGGDDFSYSGATTYTQSVGGATVTPSTSLMRLTSKNLGASITPTATLIKRTSKKVGGTITPTGALAVLKVILVTVGQAIITPAATLNKQINKAVGGASITPTGLLKAAGVFLLDVGQAVITPSATLKKLTSKSTGGASITPTAAITKQTSKTFVAAITMTAALTKRVGKAFSGTLSMAGSLATSISRRIAVHLPPGKIIHGGKVNFSVSKWPRFEKRIKKIKWR